MGDARGRWEGDTLVVETTNFRPDSVYRDANPETLRLIERFTRTAADKVEWSVTVDDPATWTRPWTFSMPLTMNAGERVMEYALPRGQSRAREHAPRRPGGRGRARQRAVAAQPFGLSGRDGPGLRAIEGTSRPGEDATWLSEGIVVERGPPEGRQHGTRQRLLNTDFHV